MGTIMNIPEGPAAGEGNEMGIQLYAFDEVTGALPESIEQQVELGRRSHLVFAALAMHVVDPYNDFPNFLPGAEMAQRAMRALATVPEDLGAEETRDWHPHRATLIHCARPTGWTQLKLREVQALAHRCSVAGWCVAWA